MILPYGLDKRKAINWKGPGLCEVSVSKAFIRDRLCHAGRLPETCFHTWGEGDCPWMLQTGISTANQKVDSKEQTYGWTGAYTQIPELSYVQYVEKSPKVSMSRTFWQCNPEWACGRITIPVSRSNSLTRPPSWNLHTDFEVLKTHHRHKFGIPLGHLDESTHRTEDQRRC